MIAGRHKGTNWAPSCLLELVFILTNFLFPFHLDYILSSKSKLIWIIWWRQVSLLIFQKRIRIQRLLFLLAGFEKHKWQLWLAEPCEVSRLLRLMLIVFIALHLASALSHPLQLEFHKFILKTKPFNLVWVLSQVFQFLVFFFKDQKFFEDFFVCLALFSNV